MFDAIERCGWEVTSVISGGAGGVDRLGELYANTKEIDLHRFLARWDVEGKSAGYKRNLRMAENCEACICIWDGVSKGTKHMIDIMKDRYPSKPLYVEIIDDSRT